jgi:hypothetical protein
MYNITTLLIIIIFIVIILLYHNSLEFYEKTISSELENPNIDLYYKAHMCTIYKNLQNEKLNPRYYDINLNRLDTSLPNTNPHTIQLNTQKRLHNNICKFKEYEQANGPFYSFINCGNNKQCESNLSKEDKINICYMFNNIKDDKCKNRCSSKNQYCNPIDNSSCITESEFNSLNLLCNGIKDRKDFNNTNNVLYRHYYCKDNLNDLKCLQQSSLELLDELDVRYVDEENCSLSNTGAAGLYDPEETRNNYYKYDKIYMNKTPCTVRPTVLARDSIDGNSYSTNIWSNPSNICSVGDGRWDIPVENRVLTNERTIHIDHHVPLKNAYVSGACFWKNPNIPMIYGNDMTPGHLKAISYTMNTSKSDKSPQYWMPYKYRQEHLNTQNAGDITEEDCKYASDWVAVKYRYDLSITQDEKDELNTVLNSPICRLDENMYPSYPIFEKDPKGISKVISELDSNILLTPLLNSDDYKKRLELKTKWLDLSRNEYLPKAQIRNDALIDIKNNKYLFGIYNDKFLDKLELKKLISILIS